jgi:hypothetical protein
MGTPIDHVDINRRNTNPVLVLFHQLISSYPLFDTQAKQEAVAQKIA